MSLASKPAPRCKSAVTARREPIAAAEKNSNGGFSYKCAGIYKPTIDKLGFHLTSTVGYRMPRDPLYVATGSNPSLNTARKKYTFKMAETFSGDPLVRRPEEPGKCSSKLELPLVSIISWNTSRPYLKDKKFRYLLTQLTPRGSLLRSGAGHAGALISSFIPRNHPGYDSRLLVRPFNLKRTSKSLDKIGYRRPKGDGPRFDLQGKPLNLKIASIGKELGLVEKVITDSYMAVGIRAEFVNYQKQPKEQFDAVLTGVRLPWPSMDISGNFHSKFKNQFPFWSVGSKELDAVMEKYSLELTKKRPNFQYLKSIHRQVFDLEPFSVLMQHSICLDTWGGKVASKARIDNRDPDWFRKIVL